VRGGLTVCLGCGASVEAGVLVTTVAGGLLPPAPPAAGGLLSQAPTAGLLSNAPAGPWLPPAPQPVLGGRAALVRRLAIAGQAGIAILYGLSVLGRIMLAADVLGSRDPGSALGSATVGGAMFGALLVGVPIGAALCWWFARRARVASTAWAREAYAGLLRGNLAVLGLTALGLLAVGLDPLALVDVAVVLLATVFAALAAHMLPVPGADWGEAR
jgi:hypothetical protein